MAPPKIGPPTQEDFRKTCLRQAYKRAERLERKRKKMREWVAKHPGYYKEYERKRRAANPGYYKERSRRRITSGAKRKEHLKKNYGLTPEQFASMLEAQGNKCGVCGTGDPGKRGWHVDHCHQTKAIRGVLCLRCNVGLGFFGDNPERLARASGYLREHNDQPCYLTITPTFPENNVDLQ